MKIHVRKYSLLAFVLITLVLSTTGLAQVQKNTSATKSVKVVRRPDISDRDRVRIIETNPSTTSGAGETTTPDNRNSNPPGPPPTEPVATNLDSIENTKERYGPGNITFNITSQIDADIEWNGAGVVNVFSTIYRDANRKSGYFYYLPASYTLGWTQGTGQYEFTATYNAAGKEGRGQTTVTAILKPKFGSNELKIVKDLLKNNLKGKPEDQYGITDLLPIPMAQAPEISFSNLSQFDVEAKNISIRAPSDLNEPIYISFTTSRIDDLMGMFFNNIGLYGDVIVYPSGEGMPASIRIPFNLKIDDPKTFGMFELPPSAWRSGWQNKTDYPVILNNYNVLMKEKNGEYRIYTWQMGDAEVPEKAKVRFAASLVPTWIDSSPSVVKMWMDYTVRPCNSCNSTVKDKIIKGTSSSRVNNIEVTILTPLAFTKAELIKMKIRSFQADPNGRSKVDLPTLTIAKDGSALSGGQIFIPDGATPEFEYLIQVFMPDGTQYEADQWKKSNDLDVVIGSNQIKELISHFK